MFTIILNTLVHVRYMTGLAIHYKIFKHLALENIWNSIYGAKMSLLMRQIEFKNNGTNATINISWSLENLIHGRQCSPM